MIVKNVNIDKVNFFSYIFLGIIIKKENNYEKQKTDDCSGRTGS